MAMNRGWSEIARLIGARAPDRKKIEPRADTERLQAQMAAMSDAEVLSSPNRISPQPFAFSTPFNERSAKCAERRAWCAFRSWFVELGTRG